MNITATSNPIPSKPVKEASDLSMPQVQPSMIGNICGRSVSAFRTLARVASNLTSYPETLLPVARVCTNIAIAVSPWTSLTKLENLTFDADRLMDGIRFPFLDVKRILHLEPLYDFTAGNLASAASKVAFIIADFGSTMHLLGFIGAIDLAKVSASIGGVVLFGRQLPRFFCNVVIGTLSIHIQTVGFLFLGIHSAVKLAMGNSNHRYHDIIWLITSIAEIAHKTWMIFGAAALATPHGIVALGVLGIIANGLGAYASYLEMDARGWKQERFEPIPHQELHHNAR